MKKRLMRGGRFGMVIGLAIAGLIASIALSSGGAARAALSAVGTVSAANFAFDPQVVTVTVSSSVKWTNNGGSHTTTSDVGSAAPWDSGTLNPGDVFTKTFDTIGVYTYHCTFHQDLGMTGTVVVVTGTFTFLPVVLNSAGP
jgi:plastocyanin